MISIKNIRYGYSRSAEPVFDGFSLDLLPGHIYGLLGRNGVGKTTLIYSIMGILHPSEGTVYVDTFDSSARSQFMLRDIFLVPEEIDLPRLSLKQYVAVTAPFYPNFSQEDLDRNLRLLSMPENPNLGSLSMGQRKKAFIAFALACRTRYLIMDEPTNGLDIPSKDQFRQIVQASMSSDRSIIISTHQVADIELLLDQVIILEHNKVLFNHSVSEITERLSFGINAPGAIFSQPCPAGFYTIAPNTTGEASPMRLDMLFNAVTQNPEINNLF